MLFFKSPTVQVQRYRNVVGTFDKCSVKTFTENMIGHEVPVTKKFLFGRSCRVQLATVITIKKKKKLISSFLHKFYNWP